ncbi:hypothetical protein CA267_000195 [Alteromonas pelagimontana]|uniref:Uncharacterized protein n=1 Tax=Alteromonas pelagimontana TaxID=1858656 RepID=A0A6M4M8L8_9ALTE|nr:hypothetical protein [Alteromonas pelagimontana]QJR79329.1 hypothetical protein CA267_000195 [Alteromonas pelagimontana]
MKNICAGKIERGSAQRNLPIVSKVILGACGAFSRGFLSNKTLSAADGSVEVEYEKFGRDRTPMDMTIRVRKVSNEHFTVTLGKSAMNNFEIESLYPQPVKSQTYAGKLSPGHSIWMGLTPKSAGRSEMSIQVNNYESMTFTQWIYP